MKKQIAEKKITRSGEVARHEVTPQRSSVSNRNTLPSSFLSNSGYGLKDILWDVKNCVLSISTVILLSGARYKNTEDAIPLEYYLKAIFSYNALVFSLLGVSIVGAVFSLFITKRGFIRWMILFCVLNLLAQRGGL